MKAWKLSFLVVMAAMVISGCTGCTPAEKPPEEPEAPPPPTALEIRQEITAPIMPLVQQYSVPWKDLKEIPQGQRFGAMDQVRAARQKHLAGENGEEGIRMAADMIEEQLRGAYEMQAWPLTVFLYSALNNVMQQRAANYAQLFERARAFLDMPRPTVTGFFAQGGSPVVFIDVYLPREERTERVQVREGEEFVGLVLVEIKGNNRGAIIEHLDTGEILDLDYGPRASR